MSVTIARALQVAAGLCRPFEGLRLRPYICPAGYPTIGYGTVYKPDGSRVTMEHQAISKETAEIWLMYELEHNYMRGVLKASPHLLLYPDVLGALTDFAYNLGVPRYRASTLRKRVDKLDWVGARAELLKWTKGGGRVLPGLVHRRKSESLYLP